MADYFPLVSRAVAALDPNTRERREAIYTRARDALDRQLLSLDPPIAQADLARERLALTDTIARVEAQYVPSVAPAKPDVGLPPARPLTPPAPAQMLPQPVPVETIAAASPRLVDPTETDPVDAPQRPKVTGKDTSGFAANRKKMTALAVGIPVMLAIGVAAYALRDAPERYRNQMQAAGGDPQQAPARKSDGRLDGTGAPAPGPKPQPPQSETPALPVAARVLFFEETGTDPRGAQTDGQVVWRLETVTAQGRPPENALRGTISVPNAKIVIDIVLKRNRDGALPASHTVEVVFTPEAGREGVKAIGPIEAREQETNPGYALKGAMVPIATNLFLIGLDNNDAAITRNLEALRDQKWFAFQFQLENGKIGAVLIEKGPTGERIFREALDGWK